jgi:tetratricopeptide (TPR) repeat protein
MGRAAVALSDDASALFWNPARLSWSEWPELQLFRTQLFDDGIAYHAGFFSYPTVDQGTFSLGYQRLGVDAIERRDAQNFLLGDFSSTESHLMAGYGRRLRPDLSIGLTTRLVQQEIDSSSALGVGIDIGAAYEVAVDRDRAHRFGLALNIQNAIEPSLRLAEEAVADPRNLKLGVAYQGAPASTRLSWALAADLDLPREGEPRWGTGLEIALDRLLMIRVGADDGRLTSGFGLGTHGFTLEYAMLDAEDLARNDRFSLRWTFGETVGTRRDQRLSEREADVQRQLGSLLERREQQAHDLARKQADIAYREENWIQARELYRRVLLIAPDDDTAQSRLDESERLLLLAEGDLARANSDLAAAMNSYKQVLERWPGDSAATDGLVAVRSILRAAEDRQAQADKLFRHSLGLFADGDLIGTRNSLDELLRLDSAHELGIELRERTEALRLQRGAEALRLAREHFEASRYREALARIARAQRLLPERDSELGELVEAWRSARDTAERQRIADARTRRRESQTTAAPSPSKQRAPLSNAERRELGESFQRGLAAFQAGHFDRAIANWQRIWDRSPGFEKVGDYLVKANLLQGIQLYSQGDYVAAMSRCRRVLEIEPRNSKAQRYLDRIREEQTELQQLRSK